MANTPPGGKACSWRCSAVVSGPAFQACSTRPSACAAGRPGMADDISATPGDSTSRSQRSRSPPARRSSRVSRSMAVATSRRQRTPWRCTSVSKGRVMSSSVFKPATTRLDTGQETKAGAGSTSVTSIVPADHSRRYLAAVAPPKPPPTTTTCGRAPRGTPAQPTLAARADVAAVAPSARVRKPRRFTAAARRSSGPVLRPARRCSRG